MPLSLRLSVTQPGCQCQCHRDGGTESESLRLSGWHRDGGCPGLPGIITMIIESDDDSDFKFMIWTPPGEGPDHRLTESRGMTRMTRMTQLKHDFKLD